MLLPEPLRPADARRADADESEAVSQVLVSDRDRNESIARPIRRGTGNPKSRFHWLPIGVVGAALAIVGIADIALVWYPPDFGNSQWQFGVISRTFNGLALTTIGIGTLMVLALNSARRNAIAVATVVCTVALLAIVAAGGLYALVLPVAWAGTPEGIRTNMSFAMGKTSLYILVYLAVYGFFTIYGWKQFITLARGERST